VSFLSTISPKRWRSWSRHGTRVRRWSSAAEARPWSACASGHLNTTTLAAFRQAPRGCVSCHKADDTHRGGFGTDRTSCHTTSRWEAARFDHAVFPIDHGTGRHTACTTCHNVPQRAKQLHAIHVLRLSRAPSGACASATSGRGTADQSRQLPAVPRRRSWRRWRACGKGVGGIDRVPSPARASRRRICSPKCSRWVTHDWLNEQVTEQVNLDGARYGSSLDKRFSPLQSRQPILCPNAHFARALSARS